MLSPSEQFGDFLSQLPLGLFATVCGAAILLFFAFAWFAFFKPRRIKARTVPAQEPEPNFTYTHPVPTPNPAPVSETDLPDTGDLPDLDSLIDTRSLKKELPEVEPPPAVAPRPAAPAPVRSKDTYRVKLNTGAMIEAKEVVAILRDPRDGRLVVQINSTGYRTLMGSPETKQEFLSVMRELSTIVNEPDDNPPAVEETIEPEPAPTSKRSTSTPPPVGPSGEMPGDLPTYKLDDSLIPPQKGGLFSKPKYEAAPVPELNIAAAIEAYLQHKLRHTSEYTGREIHVLSAPGGGVRIQVDGDYYEAVSDVTDDDVREFLSSTIQEWQERQ